MNTIARYALDNELQPAMGNVTWRPDSGWRPSLVYVAIIVYNITLIEKRYTSILSSVM